jgi:hypothetical protein
MSHRMLCAALVGLACVPLIAQSERPTLLEMARQGGGTMQIQACGPTPSLAEWVKLADLIVEGVVRTRATYLTDAGRNISTDYDVAIHRALFQREMLTSSRPGVVMPIIFKSHGGEMIVDGLRLVVDVQSNNVRMTLAEGDHVFLVAMRDREDGKWWIYPSSVFKVVNGAVLTPDEFSDLPKSMPVDTFVQRVDQLRHAAGIRP